MTLECMKTVAAESTGDVSASAEPTADICTACESEASPGAPVATEGGAAAGATERPLMLYGTLGMTAY